MEVVVSIVSLLVMVSVTVVLLYQNASLKDNVASNMQSVVDQINDSTYYSYQFDKKQENNIMNLDKNINTVSEDLNNVIHNVKALQIQVPTQNDISQIVKTQNVQTGAVNLGSKFLLSGVGDSIGNDEWLRLMDKDGRKYFGGLSADKLQANEAATLKGTTSTDILNVSQTLNIKGGKSEFNPKSEGTFFPFADGRNYIRGDTEIRGNTTNVGDLAVGRNFSVNSGVSVKKNDFGPFFSNRNDKGGVMGLGQYSSDEFRIYNNRDQGNMTFGFGADLTYDPVVSIEKRQGKALTVGGGLNKLSIAQPVQNATWSSAATKDDIVIRSDNENKNMFIQNGIRPGLALSKNTLGIGGLPQYASLDVYGDIASRGHTISLGVGNNNRGNTGASRALVKGQSELIMNYENDFPRGVTAHSDVAVISNKCFETGRGVSGKEMNAGKVCYKAFSDGLDIVGAGSQGNPRKVKVWDNMETGKITANQLCLFDTCISRDDLVKLKNLK
jgi:hypothetical protein